jgi:outer membrane protein OmpA-like peptidoglycan-associated protein
MSAQRRDTNRETAESVESIWQIYADQIGIPTAGPRGSDESLPQQSEDLMQGRRPVRVMAESVGRLLAAVAVVAVVVVAVSAGIALWRESSSSPDTADRQSLTSAPAGDADRIAQHSAPRKHAGDGLQALATAVPTPSEMVDPLRQQPKPDAAVSRPMNPVPPASALFRPDTTQTAGTLSAETKQASTDVMYRINFDFGSDGINDESKRTLAKIVVAMKANPDWRVAIEGHTDAQGTPDYNRALSERRAQAVKAYLQSAGIAPRRLSAVGFGASRPMAPNEALGNVLNRRVEFHRQ